MKKFLFAMLLLFVGHAHAVTSSRFYQVSGSGIASDHSASAAAACQNWIVKNGSATYTYVGITDIPPTFFNCNVKYTGSGQAVSIAGGSSTTTCPDGQDVVLPSATYPKCGVPPPPLCTAGATSTKTFFNGTGPLGSATSTSAPIPWPTSDGSCNVEYSTLEECRSRVNAAGTGQEFYCTFSGKQTGVATPPGTAPTPSTITPAPTDKPATSNVKDAGNGKSCPAGTTSLGIDSAGGMICGGSGTSPIIPPKTEVKTPPVTTNNPDGSTTKVETSTRSNSDGSTTTTTTTTVTGANGGTTVTQSTSTSQKPSGSGGGAGVNDSTDDKKDDFCIKNPTLNVCKNSQVTGECEETACQGDAIQCSILRQQRKEYCDNMKDTPQVLLGRDLLAGNDPLQSQIDAAKTGTTVDLASQSFDQSSFAPSACFASKAGSSHGHAIPIDFSAACNSAASIRFAVIALCSLAGFLIVARSISQG